MVFILSPGSMFFPFGLQQLNWGQLHSFEGIKYLLVQTHPDTAVRGNKSHGHVRFFSVFKTVALMSHDASNCWRGMSFSVITMEMCSFPIRHTYICSHRDSHTQINTETHAAMAGQWVGLNMSVWVLVCLHPRGVLRVGAEVSPMSHYPYALGACPKALSMYDCESRGVMIVPWWLASQSPADDQVGPNSSKLRPPPLVLKQQQRSPAFLTCVPVCAFIPQTVYWCIQLCRINTRIRYQMTQTH